MSYWYSLILRTLEGSADEWMEMVDYLYYYPTPTDDDFWRLQIVFNLVDFTDYMIAETWMGNLTGPGTTSRSTATVGRQSMEVWGHRSGMGLGLRLE